jgi:hypothetical protein
LQACVPKEVVHKKLVIRLITSPFPLSSAVRKERVRKGVTSNVHHLFVS